MPRRVLTAAGRGKSARIPLSRKREWQHEIKHMEALGVKPELEALSSKGISFSTETYLPTKLREKKWLD